MSRKLTPQSTLDLLKKEAKRWLKLLRSGDAEARARFERAYPDSPSEPTLRDVQHALAGEHGLPGWTALRDALAGIAPGLEDTQQSGVRELFEAALRGDVDRVREVLDREPGIINERAIIPGHTGLRTALHHAVRYEPVVELLIERGADPNIRDEGDNAMPLHFAAENGDLGVIRLLMEHGADPIGAGDYHELDIIGWATCFANVHKDAADYLLAHGARHNIFSAVAMGAVETIRALVERNDADLQQAMVSPNQGRTPLHLAVVKQRLDSLGVLLELGADTEAVDAAGLTALDQVAIQGDSQMMQQLIDAGAELRLPALVALDRIEEIEQVIRSDPDALKPGNRWGNLIVRASERSSGALIRMLIRLGASANASDDPETSVDGTKGYTALHAAAFHGNLEAIRVLLEHGADPNVRDGRYCGAPAGWADYAGNAAARDLILDDARIDQTHTTRVRSFIRNACPDHSIRGGSAHVIARHTAELLLKRYPEIAHDSIYTAVICGDVDEVARMLDEQPELANRKGGPKNWEPLLYLCFTRLPSHAAASDNALAIARQLLDHGADPNVYFMAGDSRYTPLVGAIGEGEEDRPPHPRRDALVRLLLERGAEPYDSQVLYNIHFHGNVLWYMELMYEQAMRLNRQADWRDPNWPMLDMGGYGCGARYLLEIAVERNDLVLAEWLLSHGANPNAPPASDPRWPKRTLHEEALRRGHDALAAMLVRYGATPHEVVLDDEERFVAASLRLDHDAVRALLEGHPQYLNSPRAMEIAVKQDRADVVAFLLDLGVPIEIENAKRQRPLHHAAYTNALAVAELLIESGAEIDPVESEWNNTPLDFAVYAQHPRMIELLGRYSRDVWNLTFIGNIERLREVFAADPGLARVGGESSTSLLMWLPPDETQAIETIRLLLEYGADPSIRSREGLTAADYAARRGMEDAAALLRSAANA